MESSVDTPEELCANDQLIFTEQPAQIEQAEGRPYQMERMDTPADDAPAAAPPRRRKWLILTAGLVAVAAIIAGCLMIFCNPAARLERQLERDWCQSTVNAYGFNSLLLLEFDDGVMTVTQKSDYFETRQLGQYRYKVMSGSSFRLEGIDVTYSVRFNENKNAMIVSPSMLQGSGEETWFNFDS